MKPGVIATPDSAQPVAVRPIAFWWQFAGFSPDDARRHRHEADEHHPEDGAETGIEQQLGVHPRDHGHCDAERNADERAHDGDPAEVLVGLPRRRPDPRR
jgi:hypothetical protein